MLNAYAQRLRDLADAGDIDAVVGLIDPLAGRDVPAAIWRQVLTVAAEHPELLGRLLPEVLASRAILGAVNTNGPVASAITACSPFLDLAEREAIEKTILELPVDEDFERNRRDRLLLALPEQLVVSINAGEQRTAAVAARDQRERRQPAWPPEDYVSTTRDAGDPDPELVALAELVAAVQTAAQPAEATSVDWSTAGMNMRALHTRLADLQVDGPLRAEAEGWLSTAAVQAAARYPLPADDATEIATEVLMAAASDVRPESDEDTEESEAYPSCGFPAGRGDAARGLLALARDPDRLPDGALDILETLAGDPAAGVRLQIAEHLWTLAQSESDLPWQLAEVLAADTRAEVRRALLNSLARLTAIDRDRALDILLAIWRSELARPAPSEGLLSDATRLLLECWIWRGAPQAEAMLDEILGDLAGFATIAAKLPFTLRSATTHGDVGVPDASADPVRTRAIGAFTRLAKAGIVAFEAEWNAYQAAVRDGGEGDQKRLKSLGDLVDHACTELYFASGAHRNGARTVSETQQERFYTEAADLIDTLCDAPLPRAAHHVMQMLEASIELDPRGVLLRTGRVLQAAHTWGYDHDQMALSLFIGLTQRYLAEYRELLTDPKCRTSLLRSLEFFVAAGWPAARRLIYRLDEAFR